MVIVILQVKTEDVLEGAHRNLECRRHGKISHLEEQVYTIIHSCNVCDMGEHLGLDVLVSEFCNDLYNVQLF